MLLQDHPVEMHVAKMNGLRLGRTLDTVHKIVRESSRPKPAEHYASRGMPPSEIVKLMAHYLGEPAVRELSAFARHPDKIIRRMVAYWLYKQHNFASVDLLITLLEDTDVGVQYEALRSLAHIGTRGGDEFCLHYLLLDDDEDPCVGPVYDDDTLADDAQYRPLFPTGLKSRWAFLHHALTDRLGEERERFVSGRVGVLGVSGQAKDLDLLLSLYVEGLERWPDTVRWEWKRALNLIDERLYQGSAIGVHYRNAPTFIHRWWQHSHEGEGF
jgi:hypothetical protein